MKKPLVILEMANNHMGDKSHALKIIKTYSKISKEFISKIDFAFKFQFRDLETYIHHSFKNTDHKQVRRFEDTKLDDNQWKEIFKYAGKKYKLISTAFDEKSVIRIVNLKFDFLKIASCSMNEWPLLEHISKFARKKNIICSLGGANENEIRNTISFFKNRNINVKYLYCVAKYPTNPENLNLSYFSYLRSIYGDLISGFSSHELPNEILSGGAAYAAGSRIFEKHVGLETKNYKLNKYSTSPNQMQDWLKNLSNIIDRFGSIQNRNKFLYKERENLSVFKRGIFLKKNISKFKNDKLNYKDFVFAFPSQKNQLTPNDLSKFNNFIFKKNIKGGQAIFKKDVLIKNSRNKIEKIREKISTLINKSKVVVKKDSRIEISHHYGLKLFFKFGMCMITILNSKYCKKLIFILHKQKHPAQYHKIKQETFFILYGKVKLEIIRKKKKKIKILKEGDLVTLYPRDIHSFSGISKDGAVIEELSTKSNSTDSFYLDSSINKNKDRKSFISLN